jgi:hypothetical protein
MSALFSHRDAPQATPRRGTTTLTFTPSPHPTPTDLHDLTESEDR